MKKLLLPNGEHAWVDPHINTSLAWYAHKRGVRVTLYADGEQSQIYLQRFVWEASGFSVPFGHKLIFINGDRRDCRIANLMCVKRGEARWLQSRPTCHLKGKKYLCRIRHAGDRIELGRFDTLEESHAAYWRAAEQLYGDLCRLHPHYPGKGKTNAD